MHNTAATSLGPWSGLGVSSAPLSSGPAVAARSQRRYRTQDSTSTDGRCSSAASGPVGGLADRTSGSRPTPASAAGPALDRAATSHRPRLVRSTDFTSTAGPTTSAMARAGRPASPAATTVTTVGPAAPSAGAAVTRGTPATLTRAQRSTTPARRPATARSSSAAAGVATPIACLTATPTLTPPQLATSARSARHEASGLGTRAF